MQLSTHLPQLPESTLLPHHMQQQQLQHPLQPQLPSSQYPSIHDALLATQSMFEPPWPQYQTSSIVSSNSTPTPYNTPNDLAGFCPPPFQLFHQPLATFNCVNSNVHVSSSTRLSDYSTGLPPAGATRTTFASSRESSFSPIVFFRARSVLSSGYMARRWRWWKG